MEWFRNFIEETREIWRTEKPDLTLSDKIDKLLEELNAKAKGSMGEEYIENILSSLTFETGTTKNSETPADIWGIKYIDNFVYLILVQVKTAKDSESPSELSKSDIGMLRVFTQFVLGRFKKSEFVPPEYKKANLLISNGYAGVRIHEDLSKEVVSAKAFTFWWPNKHENITNQVRELVNLVHSL